MNTSFRPALNALENRLNLSADPLPVLLVIADQRDFHHGQGHEFEFDLVASRVVPTAASGHKQWVVVDSSISFGRHQSRHTDDVVVDGRIITGENPRTAKGHVDFLWMPTGRTSAGSDLAPWRNNYGVGVSATDSDVVMKGQTIGENGPRHHGAVTSVKEWDANVPHTVGANETITIHGSRTE